MILIYSARRCGTFYLKGHYDVSDYTHVLFEIQRKYKQHNVPVVCLTRRNIKDHLLSLLIAIGGKRGYLHLDHTYMDPFPFNATEEQITQCMDMILEYANSLSEIDFPYQLVYYEDIDGRFDSLEKKLPYNKRDIVLNHKDIIIEDKLINDLYNEAEQKSNIYYKELI